MISASAGSISCVSRTVSTSGCFSTEMMTAGFALETGLAALDARGELDVRDLFRAQSGWPSTVATTTLPQIVEASGAADIADQVLAAYLIREAAARIGAELRQRFFHLLVGDAERAHRRRIGRNAILPHLAADRNHLRDAGDGQKPRPDREVGDFSQLHRRDLIGSCHRDQHDLAHDRADRPHLRHDVFGGSCCCTSARRSAICCRLR